MNNETRSFETPAIDLDGKVVFVTGGTGSFGKEFVKTVLARYRARKVIVYSRDEAKQHDMAMELAGADPHGALRFLIGDIRDLERIQIAMRDTDYVVHAAALKQVPTAEYNPFECIKTNVIGTENVVRSAISCGVKRVIALSTDKAANPINLYGASKLAADKIVVAANHMSGGDGPRFSAVRYGNVLGSRGSVVPVFRKMVADGAESLPITHADMTRFWIRLHQGVNFVLSSLELMQGGEIFVPKIPSMTVVDLARAIGPELPQKVVGIRPGEKLHEVLISRDDARATVELADRYVIQPSFAWWSTRGNGFDGATPVDEDFCYSSDANTEWLSVEDLQRILDA